MRTVAVEPIVMGGARRRAPAQRTHNVAGIVAMAAAMKATAASRDATVARIAALRDRLLDGLLAEVDGLRETVPRDRKVAGSAHVCIIEGVENEALLFLLDREGVCALAASACSSGAMDPSCVRRAACRDVAAGSLRLSLGWSSSDTDIDRVRGAAGRRRPAAAPRTRRLRRSGHERARGHERGRGLVGRRRALRDAGHDVVGVTMKLWGGESDTGCCSVADVDDARRSAQQLGVDHLVFNFGDDSRRTSLRRTSTPTSPAARRTRASSATGTSSSPGWPSGPSSSASTRSRPGTTPGSCHPPRAEERGAWHGAPTGRRTRATSSTCSARSSCPAPCCPSVS